MNLRNTLKRKMPATFNAVEYETERILNQLDHYASQSDEPMQLLKSILEQLDSLSERVTHLDEMAQLSQSVLEQVDSLSERVTHLDKTAQLSQSVLEQLNSLSERVACLEGILHWRADRLETIGSRYTPWSILSFEVALAEHCNLKCAGCDHFSPVAEPEFADIEEFTRDFERLSELFSGSAREIHLVGGEPLLHPDIIRFAQTARKYFPKAVIDIITNGMLLPRMGKDFWDMCHKERITIRPTKYVLPDGERIDYEAAEKLAKQYGVEYRYMDDTGQVVKTLTKYPLDMNGRQDTRRSFMLCHRANACIYLQHGRLYTCTVAPTIHHLNRHFGTSFEEDPKDFIDIYQAASAEEILEYLSHPIPFCRYCMPEQAQRGQPWRHSKKELTEWV